MSQKLDGTRCVTKSECAPEQKRAKRSLVGGPVPLEKDDPELLELVNTILDAVAVQPNGNTYRYKFPHSNAIWLLLL